MVDRTWRGGTVLDVLAGRVEQTPDRTAFTFLADSGARRSWTYAELDRHARAVAVTLRERTGVVAGDRVLLALPPGLDYIAGLFGCFHAGAIAVPAYPAGKRVKGGAAERLAAITASARPAAALGVRPVAGPGDLTWLAPEEIDADAAGERLPVRPDPDGPAFLQYTSGSTATPRGVVVGHANLLHNSAVITARFGTDEHSVGASWLPLFHDMGLVGGVLQPVHAGFPMTLMAPETFVREPLRWLREISEHGVTVSGGPTFGYRLCVSAISDDALATLDLSRWDVAFVGAEPVRAQALTEFAARFAPSGFRYGALLPCYGLAESTLMVSGGPAAEPPVVQRLSGARSVVGCGAVGDDQEVVIVDPELCTRADPGAVGEIWVRGPSVACGYWDDPTATAAVFDAALAGSGRGFLRTGDLGYLDGGRLFVTGRRKDLVVVRGGNHHPHDLEASIERGHPALNLPGAVFSVDTGAVELVVAVQEMHRHTDPAEFGSIALAARQAVADDHEVTLDVVVLVRQGGVPRTSSGKIQRSAARSAYLDGALPVLFTSTVDPAAVDPGAVDVRVALAAAADTAARTALITTYLQERIAALTGAGAVDPAAGLHRSGMDSLAALRLGHAIERDLGVAGPGGHAFGRHSVAELAALLAVAAPVADDRPATGAGEFVPLPVQRRMWLAEQMERSAVNHLTTGLRVRGPFDLAALRAAVDGLVRRHAAFRVATTGRAGLPFQTIVDEVVADVEIIAAPADEAIAALGRWAAAPFDLSRPPLVRAAVVVLGPDEHLVAFAVHHIACDGWSLRLLRDDLAAGYAAARAGQAVLPGPGADYRAALATGPAPVADLDHWQRALADVPLLDLPADRARPDVLGRRGGACAISIGEELTRSLSRLAADEDTSLFAVLLAGWTWLLARCAGQPDVAVGVPVVTRTGQRTSDVVGCFLNTVVLRTDTAGAGSFRELVRRVRRTVLEGVEHSAAPFDQVVERLRVRRHSNRNPLFDVWFSLRPDAPVDALFDGAHTEPVEIDHGAAQFDLALELVQGPGDVQGRVRFLAELFDAETVELLARRLVHLLGVVAAGPDAPLADVDLLLPGEREQLTGPPLVRTALPAAHAPIERHARAHPDDVAVVAGERSLTYCELDASAAAVALRLIDRGVRPGDRVAVALERSCELVVALLGVLKAGAAFVPLEPATPVARIAGVLDDSGARLLISAVDVGDALPCPLERMPVCPLPAPDRAVPPVAPDTLAYVIFTSGSTGRPKGVAVDHQQFAAYLAAAQEQLDPRRGDEHVMISTVAADICLTPLFVSLRSGGTLRLVPERHAVDPVALAALFDRRPEYLKGAPSHLSALLTDPRAAVVLPTRMLVLSGEPIPWTLVDQVRALAPDVTVLNEYGPTETVVASLVHRFRVDDPVPRPTSVPIGTAFGGNRGYVLDEHLRLVPPGVLGELYLGGTQVALGYLGREALTAQRFVLDPFAGVPDARMYRTGDRARRRTDGSTEYLGRLDDQVKVRGFRVEPGEVASVLRAHPDVVDAAVIAVPAPHGDHQLAAFACPAGEVAPSVGQLREHLRARLPEHMVPVTITLITSIPFTPNGKLDKAALLAQVPEPQERGEPAEPVGAVEVALSGIWSELLDGLQVGRHDNFFDVGGHSLLLMRMQHLVRERLGFEVPVVELVNHSTISAQAAHLSDAGSGPTPEDAGRDRAEAVLAARARRRSTRSGV